MGDKKYKPTPPPRRWKPGESGNPRGRKKRDAIIDEFFEGALNPKEPRERRWVLLERMFTSALNPSRKDHAKLLEICAAYYFGKPRERVEMSGPGGGPLQTEDTTPRRRPTTGEMRKRLEVLKAKLLAHAAKKAAGEQPAGAPAPTTTEPDDPEGEPTT
jgi:hypothetical protein